MTPNGKWATLPCVELLPFACATADGKWSVDLNKKGTSAAGTSSCASGTSFAAPLTGYSNNNLMLASYGQFLWLNAPNK